MSKNNEESFDARLSAAERRYGLVSQGQELSASNGSQKVNQSLVRIALQVGTEMFSALLVGVAIGWELDHWFGVKAVFLIIFSFLGGAAGVLSVWRLVRSTETS
ncbi:MAG: AtpZ/AtpI family protein [Acetobacter sp.]|nr:AtpZ/AtpI family protein [Acetobacter sp.]MBQ5515744.1 AtpZ/AtpI family protein [Acetobacter sp.]MBQ5773368.1 AtpZ/AtpI family protein [Acetobacter sp.]